MGKANKKKTGSKSARSNPISRPNGAGNGSLSAKDQQFLANKIKPLLETLSSEEIEPRAAALSEITLLCEDTVHRTLFLKEKLLKIVLSLVQNENNLDVLKEAYGLLRNVAIEEGNGSTIFLWRQGILDLVAPKLTLETADSTPNASASTYDELLENIVSLLTSMASSDSDIFDGIQSKIGTNLASFLSSVVTSFASKKVSASLFSVACEALYIFSEDNAPFLEQVSSLPLNIILSEAAKYPPLGIVYLNGLKYHSIYIELEKPSAASNGQDLNSLAPHIFEIVQTLNSFIININIEEVLQDLKPKTTNLGDSEGETDPNKTIAAVYKKVMKSKSLAEGLQISIEILTAIAETISLDPKKQQALTEAEDEQMKDASNAEDDDMDLIIRKTAAQPAEDNIDNERDLLFDSNTSLEPTFKFLQSDVLPTLVKLLAYNDYVSRSLAALNNVAWAMDAYPQYAGELWKSQSKELWTNLLPRVTSTETEGHFVEIESINSAIGVLWAISSFYSGDVPITLPQLNFLISQSETVSQLYPSEEATQHYIKLIGFFSCLAKFQDRFEITERVAEYYLSILNVIATGPKPVNGITEAVGIDTVYAIFNVFGDGEYAYDQKIYVQGGLNAKLKVLLPQLRNKFKRISKVTNYILREKATEAVINLANFIDYKASEGK